MSTTQKSMAERRNEMLADLVDVTRQVLVKEEVPDLVAELAANAVADHLASHWGGQVISFPMDHRRTVAMRELEIYRAWSEGGASFPALALRYKLTERAVRRLIARVRARLIDDQQQGLFEPAEGG